jgi:outer membrane protein
MTRLIKTVLLLTVLFQARAAFAQEMRIAVVDLQRLTTESDEGKKANEKLEKRYAEITAELQKLSRAIEDKENNLRKQELALSAARRDQLQREIEADRRNLTRKSEDYQAEMADLEQSVMGPVIQYAEAVLAAYIKEKGFTMLFNIRTENGNIVWYNAGNDITGDVLKIINSVAKPAASTPAASPAAKPAAPGTPTAPAPAK